MSITSTLVMQGNKRGESSSRKDHIRLPIIAPKDDTSSSASSNRSGAPSTSTSHLTARARLPPRSRTGCWTCRTRKVKCDEGRPICGQCMRLGHTCDYNPRLSFRDDTPRVVERMQDVTVAGGSVWDATATPLTSTDSGGSAEPAPVDDLPPFAALMTDEDRERKAEHTPPGTYNVVVNPDSFQHIPEYSDDPEIRSQRQSPLRRGSLAVSLTSSIGRESQLDQTGTSPASNDPNIVVLARFEDTTRRATSQWKESRSTTSSAVLSSKIKLEQIESPPPIEPPDAPKLLAQKAAQGGQDTKYLEQFRKVVWPQLVQIEASDYVDSKLTIGSSTEVIEETAAYFPPLFHAMMATGAISMAQRENGARLDALQHYQKALPALQNTLRSAEDLSSDGGFLTHFLFLVYEIAAAESEHSNMWSEHLSTLLRTSLLRREVFGGERYPFITWWICNVDLYALFSGAGSGEFVGTMLSNDIIPPPSFHLYPLGIDGSSIVLPEEHDTLPLILQLNYEVTILAVRLGLLARELRQETNFGTTDIKSAHQRHLDTKLRQSRVFEIQESLRQLWAAPGLNEICNSIAVLPTRSRQLLEHASMLFRASIIYSHTSMWPMQRLDTGPEYEPEMAYAASQIFATSQSIIGSDKFQLRFVVFPLFMAGFASTDGTQKMLALDLIQRMEETSIGGNTKAARLALQMVYTRQTERFMRTGHSLDVDWMEIMIEQGLQVVSFGL